MGVKFESEKQINDEFAKNKAAAIKSGCWNEKCGVALKPELVALSKSDVRRLQERELKEWKQAIYDNPQYIYRTTTNRTSNKSKPSKEASKGNNKNKKKKSQKEEKKSDRMEEDADD